MNNQIFIPGKKYIYTDIVGVQHIVKFIKRSDEIGRLTFLFETREGKGKWLLQKQINEIRGNYHEDW